RPAAPSPIWRRRRARSRRPHTVVECSKCSSRCPRRKVHLSQVVNVQHDKRTSRRPAPARGSETGPHRPADYIDGRTKSEDSDERTERGAYDPPETRVSSGARAPEDYAALPAITASRAPHGGRGVGQARVDGRPEGSLRLQVLRGGN